MDQKQNKRRFIRMDLENLPAVVTRDDDSELEVVCKNLSGMGMLIETDQKFRIGELIKAVITTEKNELSVTASVQREQQNGDSGFLYGLLIKDIY